MSMQTASSTSTSPVPDGAGERPQSPSAAKASSGSKARSFFSNILNNVVKVAVSGYQMATNETATRRAKFHKTLAALVGNNSAGGGGGNGSGVVMPELARLATPVPKDGWRIVFVRHGEGHHNTASSAGCLANRDASLTNLGIEQVWKDGCCLQHAICSYI